MEREKIETIQKKLKRRLTKQRYQHTLGVMYTAAAMAMCHQADISSAMVAALLHDCAKCLSIPRQKALCKRSLQLLSSQESDNENLLHAVAGEVLAREKYAIIEPTVLEAIRCHTTGRPGMGKLAKIIYVADSIEPGRAPLPAVEKIRQLAFQDLDRCVCQLAEETLLHLKTKGKLISPATRETYLYYKEKCIENKEKA